MFTFKRILIFCLVAAALAGIGWRVRAYRRAKAAAEWVPPENTGDYAGPLTRPVPAYNPARPPARPWLDPKRTAPPRTTYRTYPASAINGQETFYLLYLPPGYDDPANAGRRYPVIYWLHGSGCEPQHGEPFVEALDRAIRAGQAPPMIAVLPDGQPDSWYVDSSDGSQPVERIIIEDLIPHVDRTWRTIADRRGRAVEGFSMGGWGAGHLAFKYPELFCSATFVSGSLNPLFTIPEYRVEDPIVRIRRNGAQLKDKVRIRIFAGGKDWTLTLARGFDRRLTQWQIPHEFREFPQAGHDTAEMYQAMGPAGFAFYKELFAKPAE